MTHTLSKHTFQNNDIPLSHHFLSCWTGMLRFVGGMCFCWFVCGLLWFFCCMYCLPLFFGFEWCVFFFFAVRHARHAQQRTHDMHDARDNALAKYPTRPPSHSRPHTQARAHTTCTTVCNHGFHNIKKRTCLTRRTRYS